MRDKVILACGQCKRRNYTTKKNKKNTPDKLEFKKYCRFCADSSIKIDYKDVRLLRYYISEKGKIVPKRISGTCSSHQRELTTAIKRARNIALLPFAQMISKPM